jgi:hypothetical protein
MISVKVTLLVLFVLIAVTKCAFFCDDTQFQNDNYCDCDVGSDEWRTSACAGISLRKGYCSFKPPAQLKTNNVLHRFYCKGSGLLNVSIPTSRVQDGCSIFNRYAHSNDFYVHSC